MRSKKVTAGHQTPDGGTEGLKAIFSFISGESRDKLLSDIFVSKFGETQAKPCPVAFVLLLTMSWHRLCDLPPESDLIPPSDLAAPISRHGIPTFVLGRVTLPKRHTICLQRDRPGLAHDNHRLLWKVKWADD